MAAGNSEFTGSHKELRMSDEPDEVGKTMKERLSEQEEPRTQKTSETQKAVEQQSDRNSPTDEGKTSHVQQADESVQVGPSLITGEKGKVDETRHHTDSGGSGPLVKRPKQAVTQPAARPRPRFKITATFQPSPFTIAEVTENSIRVTWKEAGGNKDSYSISITPDTGVTNSTGSVKTGDPLEHTFTGLTAGTEYTISVVTVNDGAHSTARTETQRTIVAQPGAVNIAEVTENSIGITWTEAAGKIDNYRISISNTDSVITAHSAIVNAKCTLEHTFTGLTAGTEYIISVVTVSAGENSMARTKTQRTRSGRWPMVLLLNDEYGTRKGGISTVNRQIGCFLASKGATVLCTVLNATQQDQHDAAADGIQLVFPTTFERDPRKPELFWLTFDHHTRYPDLPSHVDFIVGHVHVTSHAARRIKERFPDAKLVQVTHVMPEDTSQYKGHESVLSIGKESRNILDDLRHTDVMFSVGPLIYDYYRHQTNQLTLQHHELLPKPSDIFIDMKLKPPVDTETKVVLSIGRVKGVEKLKGVDLAANTMGHVIKALPHTKWRLRGIRRDDFQASRSIIEANTGRFQFVPFTPLEYATQEELCEDMEKADVVLMPSRAEPFGLVGLEAIAAGVPVVVSNKSGLAKFLTKQDPEFDRTIVEIDDDDDEAAKTLSKRVIKILTDGPREFSAAQSLKKKLLDSEYWAASHSKVLQTFGLEG
ncbi:uncharacterized protein LOC144904408 isoform X1 [Branchiostoma floridae x Branchiostoma belcheri]